MRLTERYSLIQILTVFILTVAVFMVLFILIDAASNLDEFLENRVSWMVLGRYYLNYIPYVLTESACLAAVIAVMLVFSNMHQNFEIIALRASGLNFWQISRPALGFAVLIGAVVLWLNDRVVPQAMMHTRTIKEHHIKKTPSPKKQKDIIHNLTFYGLDNRLYFVDTYDPNTQQLEHITVIAFKTPSADQKEAAVIQEKITALSGQWTGIAWKFRNVRITQFVRDPTPRTVVRFYREKLMDIRETPQDFLKQRLDVRLMNFQELKDYIARFANSGATGAINSLKVDLYQKAALPLRTLGLVLFCLPFAMSGTVRRAASFINLGLALLAGFLYYGCEAIALAFGKGGLLPPLVAVMTAPVIFLGAAGVVIAQRFE